MKITTRTNLDLCSRDSNLLPKLPAVPSVGHRVHIRDGLQLEVVGVTWYSDKVEVELHIPRGWNLSIREWSDRYEKRLQEGL